jgi:hypothetical protein
MNPGTWQRFEYKGEIPAKPILKAFVWTTDRTFELEVFINVPACASETSKRDCITFYKIKFYELYSFMLGEKPDNVIFDFEMK